MAENPIIVFFHQSETTISLPIVFSSNSESFNPIQYTDEALLIVLNDEQVEVPELMHSNQDPQAPLGVIWHNETAARKQALGQYGQPIRLAGFSRGPGNPVFESIKAILLNNSNVARFVEEWRKMIVQFEQDELAALITYMALVPKEERYNNEAYGRYKSILGRCTPDTFKEEIRNLVDSEKFVEAVRKLETIADQQA